MYFPQRSVVCVRWSLPSSGVSCWVILRLSVWQIWQRWVNLCSATSLRQSSWRASVRRSPTYCLMVEPEMGPLPYSSKSSTWPWLTSAWPATASLTPRWRRYAKRGIDNLARDTSMHRYRERLPTSIKHWRNIKVHIQTRLSSFFFSFVFFFCYCCNYTLHSTFFLLLLLLPLVYCYFLVYKPISKQIKFWWTGFKSLPQLRKHKLPRW